MILFELNNSIFSIAKDDVFLPLFQFNVGESMTIDPDPQVEIGRGDQPIL